MVEFKSKSVFIIDDFQDNKKNFPKGNIIGQAHGNDVESNIAVAYLQNLHNEGIKLDSEDFEYLKENISSSLKRYKKKAKSKTIV